MKHIATIRMVVLALAATSGLLHTLPAAADVVGEAGWTRATPPGVSVGVGYLVLTNKGTETRKLLRIVSTVSDRVTLHQSSVDSQGVARMWPLAGIELRPGESMRFDPNGRHVMFTDLKSPFVAGTRVQLQLQFDGGEKEFTVLLEVQPLVPAAAAPDHSHHAH
jgi:periplasmic copper chaperone A